MLYKNNKNYNTAMKLNINNQSYLYSNHSLYSYIKFIIFVARISIKNYCYLSTLLYKTIVVLQKTRQV